MLRMECVCVCVSVHLVREGGGTATCTQCGYKYMYAVQRYAGVSTRGRCIISHKLKLNVNTL